MEAYILDIIGIFDSADKRVFWLYLLSSFVIAALFVCISIRKHSSKAIIQHLFSSKIWFSRSALLDYQLFVINPVVINFIKTGFTLSIIPIALAMNDLLSSLEYSMSTTAATTNGVALFTIALFVADDFSRFLLHWLMHRIPLLWSLHRLHHSATTLTPFTVYRIHPLESMLYYFRSILTQGIVLGVFYYFFGMHLSVWQWLGANIFTVVFNILGANLRHSHIPLRYGNFVEKLLISPAQHQLHHSNDPRHFDKNFGSCIAIWDRLFLTLMLSNPNQQLTFGLHHQIIPHSNIINAYLEPIIKLITPFAKLFPSRKPKTIL